MSNYKKSDELLKRAVEVTPLGAQTYSKSYRYYCQGDSPSFIERGEGCYLYDVDGNKFIDFVCALGPITIGYNVEEINDAVKNQLEKVFGDTLQSNIETETLYKDAVEKFDIYHIAVDDPEDSYSWYNTRINSTFGLILGDRLKISTIERLPMTIVECIEDSVNSGIQTKTTSNIEKTESDYITW